MIVGNVRKSAWGHGIGRHTEEEMLQLFKEDLDSLSALLGSKKFFLSEKQYHLVDITAYALLSNILLVPVEHKLKELVKTYKSLVEFTNRMEEIVRKS